MTCILLTGGGLAKHTVQVDSATGQIARPVERPRSSKTRQRLLDAAAECIAEFGWGRVTTRAIAEAADLPHGTVSYHFSGKHDLLTQTALAVVDRMFPIDKLKSIETVADLMLLMSASISSDWTDPIGTRVLMEAMRESGRDYVLRDRIASCLREYRRLVSELVRAEQARNSVVTAPNSLALATLLAAVGDGLLLHSLLDSELDIASAVEAMAALIQT